MSAYSQKRTLGHHQLSGVLQVFLSSFQLAGSRSALWSWASVRNRRLQCIGNCENGASLQSLATAPINETMPLFPLRCPPSTPGIEVVAKAFSGRRAERANDVALEPKGITGSIQAGNQPR